MSKSAALGNETARMEQAKRDDVAIERIRRQNGDTPAYLSNLPLFRCPVCAEWGVTKMTIFKDGCIEHSGDPTEAA